MLIYLIDDLAYLSYSAKRCTYSPVTVVYIPLASVLKIYIRKHIMEGT